MSTWKTYRLGDCCAKIGSGATPRGGKEAYKDDGVSLVRSQNVLDFSFSTGGLAFIDDEQAAKLDNVSVEPNDILLNITGDSVARVCIVPDYILPARVNQHVAIIRPEKKKLNSQYLKYYLLNPVFKNHLLALASSGATRNALTKSMIEGLEIVAPNDVEEQKGIAEILSSLDDKIELSNQISKNLEDLIFAFWEKLNTGEAKLKLNDLIELNPKISLRKGQVVKYLGMTDVPESGMSVSGIITREFSSGSKFQKHDTLLARITPCLENGKTAFVNFLYDDEVAFGSTEFIVMRAKNGISPYFVYALARNSDFRQFAIVSMTGTSGRQRVQTDRLIDYEMPEISDKEMEQFHNTVEPLFETIQQNREENTSLTELRNLLLLKLMSGELTINQARNNGMIAK